MKKLVLLLGIPGSGKTTLAMGLVRQGFVRICADDIRAELYGNTAEQGDPKLVMQIFFERLEALFPEGKKIVVDNMNTKYEHRQQILDRAKKAGYRDIELWVLDVPLIVCLERNKKRSRQVPEDVITNSHRTLNNRGKPTDTEGKIIVLQAEGDGKWLSNCCELEIELRPEKSS